MPAQIKRPPFGLGSAVSACLLFALSVVTLTAAWGLRSRALAVPAEPPPAPDAPAADAPAVDPPVAKAEREPRKAGPTFLWKVTSDTNTVYLLGSVHVATEEFYPLPKEVEDAFKQSTKLAVEVNVADVDQAQVQGAVIKYALNEGGKTLSETVSKETADLLKDYSAKKGIPTQQWEPFKPWFVSMAVTMVEIEAMGFRADLGIDMHFLKQAKQADKPILELETAEGQLEMMSGFSTDVQDKMLKGTLEQLDEMPEMFKELVEAWQAGDAETLEKELIDKALEEDPDLKPVFEKMFDERNVKMAEKIEGYLKEKEPVFVVVGAGHLVGDKGLVKLLEEKKYKPEQVQTKGE